MGLFLITSLLHAVLSVTRCAADDGTDNSESEYSGYDTVLGVLQTTVTSTSYVTLILYALFLSIVGWVAVLYPFVFCPKFDATVRNFTSRGVKCSGKILSMRKGRVFNPLRYCLPTRYNCYVTVEYNEQRKELAVDETVMKRLAEREQDEIDVYTLPEYPQSGILDEQYQGHEVTNYSKMLYASSAAFLLGLGIWTSFVSTDEELTNSPGAWKVWVVVLGHLCAFGTAYAACNFTHSIRVEALLFGSADDDGLQDYVNTHTLANRGCSRSVIDSPREKMLARPITAALADSKDEVSENPSADDANAYRVMS